MSDDEEPLVKNGAAYKDIRPHLETFDMIAFRGGEIVSDAISRLEEVIGGEGAGVYTHVGVVLRGDIFPEDHKYHRSGREEVYVWESTQSGRLGDGALDVEGKSFLGVQLRVLDEVVEAYDVHPKTFLAWCSMLPKFRPSPTSEEFITIFNYYNGIPYDFNCINLLATAISWLRPLRCCFSCYTKPQFCSELVANLYKSLGTLSPEVDARNVLPSDYFSNFAHSKGGHITFDKDEEIPVLFSPAVPFTLFPDKKNSQFSERLNLATDLQE